MMNVMYWKGEEKHIEQILELGDVMYKESIHYGKSSYNKEKVESLLRWAVNDDKGIIVVATAGEKVVGGFLGCIGPLWFSEDDVAMDMAIFLHPSFRHGMIGCSLIQEALKQAKSKGVDQFMISNATGYESERVERLFEYVGMDRIGGVFIMNLENV